MWLCTSPLQHDIITAPNHHCPKAWVQPGPGAWLQVDMFRILQEKLSADDSAHAAGQTYMISYTASASRQAAAAAAIPLAVMISVTVGAQLGGHLLP